MKEETSMSPTEIKKIIMTYYEQQSAKKLDEIDKFLKNTKSKTD